MENIKLVYFKGCPEAKEARAALLTSGMDFEVVLQDELEEGHALKRFSSPTILRGEEILYGNKLNAGASACSYQKIDSAEIHSKLKGKDGDNGKKNIKKPGFLSAIAALGSGIAVALCPMCIPAIGAFLTSIGLGIVVQDAVLQPALVAMLLATIGGFFWSYLKKHGNIWPFMLGVLFSASMYAGRYIYLGWEINFALMYGSIPALIGVALWNLYLNKKGKKTLACGACVAEAAKI